jgi:uncharacterized membrane protein YsdA (DUF1294 family)
MNVHTQYIQIGILLYGGVLSIIYYLVTFGQYSGEVSLYFMHVIATSLVLCAYYAIDKMFALADKRRIPESALHVLALFGGFLGGWIGMAVCRHKKNKMQVVMVLVLATLLHVAGYIYLTQ